MVNDFIRKATPRELQEAFRMEQTKVPNHFGYSLRANFYINGGNIGEAGLYKTHPNFEDLDIGFGPAVFVWRTFYPLRELEPRPYRCGLGTLAHVNTLLNILEEDPEAENLFILHRHLASTSRSMHLKKIGLTKRMKFGPYMARSLENARKLGFDF